MRLSLTGKNVVAVALAGLILVLSGAAQAQYREEPAGRVGGGSVIRIFEGNRFDRCSGVFLDGNDNMLRIAFNTRREYALSIPQVVVPRGQRLEIAVGAAGIGSDSADAVGNQNGRAWRMLDQRAVDLMMRFRGPIIVATNSTRFTWNLGASVEDVLVAIENCTNRSMGWR